MCADSTRCFRTFWPYEVRYCNRPRSLIISAWMSVMPTSATASSPARRICSSSSRRDRSWISSMRAGWIRPSATSFSSVIRAASRRTGSKHDRTTASGVSSTMRFTPVVASKARMLRPSRPMMRPFMSSLGSANTDTVDSAVCSDATRWMAIVTILRARSSPSSRARCSISRTWVMAARLASSTTCATRCSLASADVMPAIRSSSRPMLIGGLLQLLPDELQLLVAFLELERPRLDRRDPLAEIGLRLEDPALQARDLLAAGADVLLGLPPHGRGLLAGLLDGADPGRVGLPFGLEQGLLRPRLDALRIRGGHRLPDKESRGDPHHEGERCRPLLGPSFLPTHVERVLREEPRKGPAVV